MNSIIQLWILIHLKEIIIFRLAKNKAMHRILYAIKVEKVKENKFAQDLLY